MDIDVDGTVGPKGSDFIGITNYKIGNYKVFSRRKVFYFRFV